MEEIVFTREQFNDIAGNYHSDELQVAYNIFAQGNQLFVKINNSPKKPMEVLEKDLFQGIGNMTFQRSENGNITGFTLDVGKIKKLRFVKS